MHGSHDDPVTPVNDSWMVWTTFSPSLSAVLSEIREIAAPVSTSARILLLLGVDKSVNGNFMSDDVDSSLVGLNVLFCSVSTM